MESEVVVSTQGRAWLEHSILQPHIADFCADLQHKRYAAETMQHYVACVAHFAAWVTQHRLNLDEVDERSTVRFVAEHLPHCDCPPPVRTSSAEIKAALAHLLQVLRACGAIAKERTDRGPFQDELDHFDRYMAEVNGLARNTRRYRIGVVRRFLAEQGASGSIVFARIQPADIHRFVLGGQAAYSKATIKLLCGTVRSYLHFRAFMGDSVQRLLDAIPSVAHWRLASLPEALSELEVQKLLGPFRLLTRSAKRDYAMVRCLTDIGLRACEVVQLRLSDVDWRAGTIRLAVSKSRRVHILPLPAETARAIAEYLRAERPQTSNRALFVRHCAPFDEPIKANVVRKAVMQGYRRCGLSYTRVHILRHSLARRLLQAGSPLKEIADILRHRCLNTSMIYTKVDTNRLSAVSMPWPGRSL